MSNHSLVICKASAGAGKTHTLVKHYLEMAFDAKATDDEALKRRFKRILAITFTNKAANEMKERIMQELWLLCHPEHDKKNFMRNDLSEEMKLPKEEIERRARIVRSAILHNYSDLEVSTIDSFMSRVVKTFAHDLGLPMRFEVQIDQNSIIEESVDKLMSLAGAPEETELTDLLYNYTNSKMDEGTSHKIDNSIKELAKILFEEDTPAQMELIKNLTSKDVQDFITNYKKECRRYESKAKAASDHIIQKMKNIGLEPQDLYKGKSGFASTLKKWGDGELVKPSDTGMSFLEDDTKLIGSKTDKSFQPKVKEIRDEMLPAIKEVLDAIPKYNTLKLIMKNLYALVIMRRLGEIIMEYSGENEIVHISEFNKVISKVVKECADAPFIYERIGNRYWNYLIDEFQDTSVMQWQNLVPLIRNGLSEGKESLVVGDAKQAIYRFRKGDVNQFIALPEITEADGSKGKLEPSSPILLQSNFRSTQTVVDFNNDFFQWLTDNNGPYAGNQKLQQIYIGTPKDGKPELYQYTRKEGGYLEIAFFDKEDENAIEKQVFETIRHQRELGWGYKDMLILAREKKDISKIAEYLSGQLIGGKKIPIVSSESFLLKNSRVVMLIKSLMQYLVAPDNKAAALQVIQYLEQLEKLPKGTNITFSEQRQYNNLERFLREKGYEMSFSQLRMMTLYDCCEEILRALNLNQKEMAYTATFLDTVAAYGKSHHQDMAEFLTWLEEKMKKLAVKTEGEMDAVKMLTIHSAKGLGSPIVIYAIPAPSNKPNHIWVHSNNLGIATHYVKTQSSTNDYLEEFNEAFQQEQELSQMDEMNVMYVALTRAQEKMFIYCETPAKESKSNHVNPPRHLRDYVDSHDFEQKGDFYYRGSDDAYTENSNAEKKTVIIQQLSRLSYPQWNSRIKIAEPDEKKTQPNDDENIRIGLTVHEVLEKIYYADEAEQVVSQYIEQHPMAFEEQEHLKHIIHKLITKEDCWKFFDPRYKIRNESPLMIQGEPRRPDRIVESDDEIWVVDYKTGKESQAYFRQVEDYCHAIASMGTKPVKGYLIYLEDDCRLVTVDGSESHRKERKK